MRLGGTLRSWHDDRGYGFIAPTHGGAELFVHISALPGDGSRPTVGEKLTYEIGRGKNGRPQAINVRREAIGLTTASVRSRTPRPGRARSVTKLVGTVVLLALAVIGFQQYRQGSATRSAPQPLAVDAEPVTASQVFQCDGRTHCSQMTSCAEAKFFLKNCPGTQMDGDNDGTPCEQQWCTSPFSK